jgi:lysophospholipase L1-like esterase
VLAVVGASISYGVGARDTDQAWPQLLAQEIGWQALVSADPGVGFLAPGTHSRGPIKHLIGALHLSTTRPRVVVVQAGYNDIGMPAAPLSDSVRQVILTIRAQDPQAQICLLSVFPKDRPSPAAQVTDALIVAAARSVDPQVHVFDPLAARWVFPTMADRLHPSPVGHRWIADQLAKDFRHSGLIR